MTQEDTGTQRRVEGHVKWFDPTKGFGFVVSPDSPRDILLHANVLRNFGQSSVLDGSMIALLVQDTERGLQATDVLEIIPPANEGEPLRDLEAHPPEDIASQPIQPARVKWFDKAKGFGFANIFGDSADVFIHIEILRRSGLAELQPGEAIGVRVMAGERGAMAMEILGWERAAQ